jgi:GNAT superfamily N-acetyltransferase
LGSVAQCYRAIAVTESIAIRPLAAEDAVKLTACFERCYGPSYVNGVFYDPAAIRARLADGRLCSVVAIDDAGEIVGHMALTTPHPGARTVELGNTIVDPRCRGQGLAPRLAGALVELCRRDGHVGFHHYPTTAHAIMQKLAVEGGGVETGVMLAYIPAGTDYKELSGTSDPGRLAVVVVYQPIAAAPAREVCLPPRFAPMLRAIYARARLERSALAPAAPTTSTATRLHTIGDERRSLLRIEVERIGADLRDRVRAATRDAPAEVTHVDLLLSDPAAPHAVEALRADDFFFCALLPEFAASDVLRLQRLRDPAEPRALPTLVYPDARAILKAALDDREAARAGTRTA